jgi:hypothetical protein
MSQGHAESERHQSHELPPALPEELARTLAPATRRALGHPIRRGILRELHRDDSTPRTPSDLLPLFPGASRATITYHANILCDCGSATATATATKRGTITRSFVSDVVGNPEYQAVLAATEQLDTSP